MCGRFTIQYTWAEYHDALSLIPDEAAGRNDPPRYNVAPTLSVGFLSKHEGEHSVKDGQWWLVPHWAKEKPKWALFNARSEDAHKKPAFRDAYKWGRCLIPADGYYEWTKAEDGGKDPHYIHLPDIEPFFFAGLWAHNKQLDITSCTILTAEASKEIIHLHNRMPIILNQAHWEPWLDLDTEVEEATALLNENRGSELVSYRVSREVNSSRASCSQLIKPIE